MKKIISILLFTLIISLCLIIPIMAEETALVTEETAEAEETNVFIEWIEKNIRPEVLTAILSIIALGVTAICERVKKSKSISDVIDAVTNKTVKESVSDLMGKAITPIQSKIGVMNEQMASMQNALNTFSKIMLLAQENTPESRLAIIDTIAQSGFIPTTQIEEAKETIKEEIANVKAITEEKLDTLASIERKARPIE